MEGEWVGWGDGAVVGGESLRVGEGDGVVGSVGAGGDGEVALVDGAVVVAAEEEAVARLSLPETCFVVDSAIE